jgi:hypothetical protein
MIVMVSICHGTRLSLTFHPGRSVHGLPFDLTCGDEAAVALVSGGQLGCL